jgi:hypothetical protein
MTEKEEGERRDVGVDVCDTFVLPLLEVLVEACDREKEIEREVAAAETAADLCDETANRWATALDELRNHIISCGSEQKLCACCSSVRERLSSLRKARDGSGFTNSTEKNARLVAGSWLWLVVACVLAQLL